MGARTVTKKSNQIDMLSGSLLDKICLFALPLAASSVLQQLFNSADVAVVGRFAGSQALAAVGATSSTINLLINLFVGLSVGANVVIGQFIGQQKSEKIAQAVHTIVLLALVCGCVLIGIGQIAARPILSLLHTPDDVLDLSVRYLKIYFLGMPFFLLYNFGSAILRSKGDSKRPLYCLTLAGAVNLLLNLLLVIVFKLNVAGVAIATVVSNVLSALLILSFLVHENAPFTLNLRALSLKKEYVVRVAKIGMPAGLQGMVFAFSKMCIQSGINSFGASAIAGAAAAHNYECFAFFVINGFVQACVTFTSQNFGAHQFDRCKKVFRLSMACAIVGNMVVCALFIVFRTPLVAIYSPDADVIRFGILYMLCQLPFDWLMCGYEVSGGAMRGMGRSMTPTLIIIFGTCVFRMIWIFTIFPRHHTFAMLISVYPASWILTACVMLTVYFLVRKKMFAPATVPAA